MSQDQADVRSYYEAEATASLRGHLKGWRIQVQTEFLDLLDSEGRQSVVDFGCGPGRDLRAFADSGRRCIGLDTAIGNARLAAEQGLVALACDVRHTPLRGGAFDAAWSMSTLMHLDDHAMATAMNAMASSVVSEAPVWVGLWGGDGGVAYDDSIHGQRRVFHRRTFDTNRALVHTAADIEHGEERRYGDGTYHFFQLRTR